MELVTKNRTNLVIFVLILFFGVFVCIFCQKRVQEHFNVGMDIEKQDIRNQGTSLYLRNANSFDLQSKDIRNQYSLQPQNSSITLLNKSKQEQCRHYCENKVDCYINGKYICEIEKEEDISNNCVCKVPGNISMVEAFSGINSDFYSIFNTSTIPTWTYPLSVGTNGQGNWVDVSGTNSASLVDLDMNGINNDFSISAQLKMAPYTNLDSSVPSILLDYKKSNFRLTVGLLSTQTLVRVAHTDAATNTTTVTWKIGTFSQSGTYLVINYDSTTVDIATGVDGVTMEMKVHDTYSNTISNAVVYDDNILGGSFTLPSPPSNGLTTNTISDLKIKSGLFFKRKLLSNDIFVLTPTDFNS
jgi:hypothetical protein